LGRIVFTFKQPLGSVIGQAIIFLAFGIIFVGTGSCLAVGGQEGDVYGKGRLGLGIVLMILARPFMTQTRTSFVAYEGGLASPKAKLAWSDVVSITLGSTQRSRGGSYQGTQHSIVLTGPANVKFDMNGYGPETEAFLQWFRDAVVPRIARLKLDR